jgi:hypothetical protein
MNKWLGGIRICQQGITGKDKPGKDKHGGRLILGLGANDKAAKAFARLHGELFAAST